jgi:hypothetical protein
MSLAARDIYVHSPRWRGDCGYNHNDNFNEDGMDGRTCPAQGIGGVRSSREAAGANAEPRIARWGEAPCAQIISKFFIQIFSRGYFHLYFNIV